jgi:hypothetical protein
MEETEDTKPKHQFKSKEEMGGSLDPRINSKGNPDIAKYAGNRKNKPDGTKLTNRELREREFMSLLRKIKPHTATAIARAASIMNNREASHQHVLKAATILLEQYKETLLEVYDKDYDEEVGEEVQQQNSPVFSLKVVGGE